MKKTARSLLFITAAVITVAVYFIAGYISKPVQPLEIKRLELFNKTIFPKALVIIKTGDMVTRLGSDITSEMIRQLNDSDKSFSHCGIASIENDTVFIYHAIGGEFNPDQKLKRETLYSFAHPSENKALGIFSMGLTTNQTFTLKHLVAKYYASGIPFDLAFNYQSEDRFYCAEFVAKTFSRSLGDSSWFHFTNRKNFSYITVETLCRNYRSVEISRWSF